jgi:hypothetical protein
MTKRSGYIHTKDKRTDFIVTFRDTQKDPVTGKLIHPVWDISTMVKGEVTFTKPDGSQIKRDETTGFELYSGGQDGRAHFLNDGPDAFEIDQGDDYWSISAWVELLDGSTRYTDTEEFYVRNKE